MPSTCCHTTLPQQRAPGCPAPPRELPRWDQAPWKGRRIRMERTGPWRFPPGLLCTAGALPRAGDGPAGSTGFQVPATPREGTRQPRPFPKCPLVCRPAGVAQGTASGHTARLPVSSGGVCGAAGPTAGPPATAQHSAESSGKEESFPSPLRSLSHPWATRSCSFPFPAPTAKPSSERAFLLPAPGCARDPRAGGPSPG